MKAKGLHRAHQKGHREEAEGEAGTVVELISFLQESCSTLGSWNEPYSRAFAPKAPLSWNTRTRALLSLLRDPAPGP